MERDELRERIARALYEDAHRHQEPEHFYPWERVQSTIVAKGYHRQADAVLAALSGVPATTCTECGGTGGGPVRVSGDEWELQECGVCGGMVLVSAEDLDRFSTVAMAQCEDCGLTYAVDAKGSPTTDYPFTCDDCSGYVEKVHIRVYGNGEWAWLDDLGSSPWPDARTFVASLPREAWREVAR